jgi:predicted Zn-dependent protease with MMP-like domain
MSPPFKVGVAMLLAMSIGLVVLVVGQGFSVIDEIRWLEELAIAFLGSSVALGSIAFIAVNLARWNPESEEEFDKVVRLSEQLAREGLAPDPYESEFMVLDPLNDQDFAELVKDALDDLPSTFLDTLDHVPVIISDGGSKQGAYGLYQGATIAHRDYHDRIVIFRDTLRRDFGHDPLLLRAQVTRTVRHELAHHVGFDEPGVGDLGL